MEHGSSQDQSASTFALADEDHTLANSLRYTLNQDPRVTFCGYSIPHPSDARVNIRVQTTGDPASEVLKDSCQDLMMMCQHVRTTLDQAVVDFRNGQRLKTMDDYSEYSGTSANNRKVCDICYGRCLRGKTHYSVNHERRAAPESEGEYAIKYIALDELQWMAISIAMTQTMYTYRNSCMENGRSKL